MHFDLIGKFVSVGKMMLYSICEGWLNPCIYIRNGIKYKQRKDLDINYDDDNNEFQSSWIEVIKEHEPNIVGGCFTDILKKHQTTSSMTNSIKLKKNIKIR